LTPFGHQVMKAAVMSMQPQRSPAMKIAANAREFLAAIIWYRMRGFLLVLCLENDTVLSVFTMH
jgi:hypothetical protein